MSNDLNQCQFIGRLGKDVDMRFTPNGDAVANLALACGWETRDKSGVKKEGTEWVNVSVFGKLAELCGEYLIKGSQVYVQGRLKTEKWQDKTTGADRYTTRINADKVQFLGGKSDKPQGAGSQPTNQGAGNTDPTDFESMPDDIPF
jgi:single-strand DNA-binding protein